MERWLERGDRALFLLALAGLLFGAAGGAWGADSDQVVLAATLERSAQAPLYSALAGVAAQLPFGEPWFRVAALSAVLGATLLVGIARAARALLPKDPVAGYVAALAVAVTPPFRDAAGFPGPTILAATGCVWALGCALAYARAPDRTRARALLAAIAVVVGSAPWLGLVLVIGFVVRTPRDTLAIAALGILVIAWWAGAVGELPAIDPDLSIVIERTGRGAAAVVVGAGLVGVAFAVVTGLPYAPLLALFLGLTAGHATLVDHAPLAVVALFAPGLAVIPSGIVRAVPDGTQRRHAIAAIAGLPLIAAALLSGPAFGIDDPGHAPARVASDLAALPAGPGVLITTRPESWSALRYAQQLTGTRPDLAVIQAVDPSVPTADAAADVAARAGQLVGADVPALGRIPFAFAYPRGRAYLLSTQPPTIGERAIPPPPRYASDAGEQLATLIAVDRARYEAGSGRLGDAARAAGLGDRFGAAELAILSTTRPVRPAFFGFLPRLDERPPGRWLLDVLGDDLAWVAGLEQPTVDAPPERKLHALWRQLWSGAIQADDPQLAAPELQRATRELLDQLAKTRR